MKVMFEGKEMKIQCLCLFNLNLEKEQRGMTTSLGRHYCLNAFPQRINHMFHLFLSF